MGLYDRDYYRKPTLNGVGQIRALSFTTWLIIANVAVFVIEAIVHRWVLQAGLQRGEELRELVQSEGPLHIWGWFSISTTILHGQVWRLITCQFLHAGVYHLLVNMIALWLFGPVVELTLGFGRYALFYLVCGVAGPLTFTLLWATGVLLPDPAILNMGLNTPMVGASAGIFGVLMAAAHLSPDREIFIYFMYVKLKYLAWFMMGLAAYTVLVNGGNAGGQAAHLGGGLLGWALIRRESLLNVLVPKRRIRGRRVKDWTRDFNR